MIHLLTSPLVGICNPDLRATVLNEFESEMLKRSAAKVKASADAAEFLHSEIVLHERDGPRRRFRKKKDELDADTLNAF